MVQESCRPLIDEKHAMPMRDGIGPNEWQIVRDLFGTTNLLIAAV